MLKPITYQENRDSDGNFVSLTLVQEYQKITIDFKPVQFNENASTASWERIRATVDAIGKRISDEASTKLQ